ncbi:L,D-transpeptidase [Roseisolibacter sp. H3M3-2]|uniref:L,D-transpeptidase n=1 Tax=Roseisolibacter sp. H3M3-2 TaxID=3031323 RepID=UPI0023D9D33A|nr:L,D-transpeptidase [Roseisolibacter sp. H3M3-2]MDF1503364.1 L,D-transpeptidase [Roseisolibacter sp. H3M3-2]
MLRAIRSGGRHAWWLLGALVAAAALTSRLLAAAADARWERDVARMVFNDNLELLRRLRAEAGEATDSLTRLVADAGGEPRDARPYLVVSVAERRLWYKRGDSVLFSTQVATGSGRTLVKEGGGAHWKFETPRGRLVVIGKDSMPRWVPPDWHYVEQARKRGLGLVRLRRGEALRAPDGAVVTVRGSDVVRVPRGGAAVPLRAADGREIVVGGNLLIPPFGTNQRRYPDVLGTRRLNLGDGYALHGTNRPETVGQAVSHGCVRLRNEDVEWLYDHVPVGTPVYIY